MASRRTTHFIGRHEEREQIKELLKSSEIQVLQIYGLPSAGKTELIRQVCQEISSELEVQILFRRITNGQWPNTEIGQFLNDVRNSEMLSVIVLDCFENFSKMEEFDQFCLENLWNLHSLKIILVFQGLIPLKIEGFTDERIQVKPMYKEDARCLFYRRTKLMLDHDQSDQQVDQLIDYCGGLPGQIVELTNKISQFPPNASLAELYEFVTENKSYCQSEDIFVKLDRHIQTLTPGQRHALSEVVYFPGKFTVKDVTEIADYKNDLDTKFWFLYPLLGHGLLKSTDEDNRQFQVPALFQDYANRQLAHLRHEDTTKLKFSTIIGKTLVEAEHLWKNGLIYEALGIMTNNWTNVQKLLRQAIHAPSDGNSFQIYFKVVIDASKIISLCYPNEAKHFCKAIVDTAHIFGSEDQQALTKASYGHTLVESSQKEALELYKTSEGILRKHSNHKYQLIILLYHMSNAYYRSGKLKKGIRYAEEALSIQVTEQDPAEVQHVKTYAASFLAYNLIFATEYKRAEEILRQTLQEVGESGHPTVPTLLNSLGLKEERSKGDLDKALTCYFASLAKKRKVAKFQEHLLVTTLCNVAGQLSKTKRKHDFSLKFLFEAEGIRRRAGWVHAYSGLVVWNIGMVFMRKQMLREGLAKIQEAEELYRAVNRSHYVNAEVKIWLAHCHLLLDDAQEAKRIFLEVVRDGEMYHQLRPQGEFVLNALEHLVHLSIQDPKEQATYITEVLKELPRLNQSPGVGAINLQKYRLLLVKYAEIMLKISNDDAKSEPRSGIFLQCIPDTCIACQEVLNYTMCSTDTYLQKMNLLTPTRQFFERMDSAAARSLAHREQTKNQIGRRDLGTSTTDGCWTSKEPHTNYPSLKSEFSDESFDSNILPLPVREFRETSVHSESIGSPEVFNALPDLNALFSLEEPSVDCENNRVQPEVRGDIPHREQTNNQIGRRDLGSSTTEGCRTSKEPDTNYPSLKSEFSDESFDSNILPLPVREFRETSVHSESIGSPEVFNALPDFNTLLSLEENKRVQSGVSGDISARQNSTSETISKNGTMAKNGTVKSINESYSSNLSGESTNLFGGQRDLKSSTGIHQTEHFKNNLADNRNNNVGAKFPGYSTTLNGAGNNQKTQAFLRSQRTLENLKTKQKSNIPSQQIANVDGRNEFQISNSILSKPGSLTANIVSGSTAPMRNSSKNSDYSHSSNGQSLHNGFQRLRPNLVKEQQSAEHFWKTYEGSQYNFVTKAESPKPSEKKSFGPFKEKTPASKYSEDLRKFSTNFRDDNANFSIISSKSQSKLLGSRIPMNGMMKNKLSRVPPRLPSRREPVEHEESPD